MHGERSHRAERVERFADVELLVVALTLTSRHLQVALSALTLAGSAAQVCGRTHVIQDGRSPDMLPSVALLDVDT
jgi:hypothetical protein